MEKVIEGFTNYTIDKLGTVRSYNRNEVFIKKTSLSRWGKEGYEQVNLCSDGKVKCFKIHRLVALYFVENEKELTDVNHINGNKLDNKAENLEWISKSDNCKHAHRTGLQSDRKGVNHWINKLTNDDVYLIRLYKDVGYSLSKMAKMFDVSKTTISTVASRKTWKHI